MIYDVYIDVLAINNFFADLTAFIVVRFFLQRKVSAFRILAGAAASTLGSCLAFIFCRNMVLYLLIVNLIWNPAVLYFIFREKSRSVFFTDLAACYLVFLLSGGIMGWLYADGNGIFSYEIAIAVVLSALIALILWSRHRLDGHVCYLQVKIRQDDKLLCLHAFADSGNLLHDPYTEKPVSMIDREYYESVFGHTQQVRLIPYESLGCQYGLLKAITVEELNYSYKGCSWKIKKPVLGLAEHALFEKKPYQMIINPQEMAAYQDKN